MHSLSLLLLGAAASVNAMLGAQIETVILPDNRYFCAEDCVHQGVFFGKTLAACPENETVVFLNKDGQPDIDSDTESSLLCRGHPALSKPGYGQRERKADDEVPKQCELRPIPDPGTVFGCLSERVPSGTSGETLQWADVAKLVEGAAAGAAGQQGSKPQPQPQPQPPAGQTSREKCN
ncbi:hypothetical protein BM221_010596 [Beauveria bassiana]|uniref:Uncharacterized protein n=1 Tax=Beauveria bassiana TaxID=176275 RepID=A0A2N6N8A7_BEABA|nr:hypothetical protein BM221_010596 [Beauveria bassiana]